MGSKEFDKKEKVEKIKAEKERILLTMEGRIFSAKELEEKMNIIRGTEYYEIFYTAFSNLEKINENYPNQNPEIKLARKKTEEGFKYYYYRSKDEKLLIDKGLLSEELTEIKPGRFFKGQESIKNYKDLKRLIKVKKS